MDELIILLIKALIEGFGSGPRKKQEQARAGALVARAYPIAAAVRPAPSRAAGRPAGCRSQAASHSSGARRNCPCRDASHHRSTGASSITPRELGDRSTLRRRFILSEILRPPLALRRPTPGNHHA